MEDALLSRHLFPLKKKVHPALPKKRILVLAGPTASGKTDLSLSLAEVLGGEVVSADSCQVYRGMDVGTAKATLAERARVPHHLIDMLDISSSFNVAEFYQEAQGAFRSILNREHVPIVVGGSGFYVHSLLYGPPLGPPSIPAVREQIEKQLEEFGVEVLYERLQMLDPEYAKQISELDRHKIVRALEIMTLSERKVSDFPKADHLNEQEYDFRCWFIYYPKEILYTRIEERCDTMLKAGFLDEVRGLDQAGIRENFSAAQAIGYRQALEFLDSPQTSADYELFVTKFKRASRQFAKRQFTWFRKEPLFRWVNIEDYSLDHLKELLLQDFERG